MSVLSVSSAKARRKTASHGGSQQTDDEDQANLNRGSILQRLTAHGCPARNWMWKRLVFSRLRGLSEGQLTIRERISSSRAELNANDGTEDFETWTKVTFGQASNSVTAAELRVLDRRFYGHVIFGGSLGAAEAYLRGYWETDDLVGLIQLFACNFDTASSLNSWASLGTQKIAQLVYRLRRNTKSGSRKNIAAHYDLGNEFYAMFLDPTMTYSSAVYPVSEQRISLEEAQTRKYDRICQKLGLSPTDRVMEVGCGWGGFAIHAVTHYGCHVTATTISHQQYTWAKERIRQLNLSDRIHLVESDYRDLAGQYDKLVSIEMIEAVGFENLNEYFAKCSSLLTDKGLMTIQAITVPDERFESYRVNVDFIQRYVFPGGFLPSLGLIHRSIDAGTDLRVVHNEDFAGHYAETLSRWSTRFEENIEQVAQLDCFADQDQQRFVRLWRYYLAYCEAGFRQRLIGLAQLTFAKPGQTANTLGQQLPAMANC